MSLMVIQKNQSAQLTIHVLNGITEALTSQSTHNIGHFEVITDDSLQLCVTLSLSGKAPAYLAADCQLVSDEGRHLPHRGRVVRRTYSNYGDRCFAAAGLKLWSSLPAATS